MYRVIKRFNDFYTGQRYNPGDEYKPEGKGSEGRVDHLIARGFVEDNTSYRRVTEDEAECAPDDSTEE